MMPWITDEQLAEFQALQAQADQPSEEREESEYDLSYNAPSTGDEPTEVLIARAEAAAEQAGKAATSWERRDALRWSMHWKGAWAQQIQNERDRAIAQSDPFTRDRLANQQAAAQGAAEAAAAKEAHPGPVLSLQEEIAAAEQAGDWRTSIRLKNQWAAELARAETGAPGAP